MFETPQFTEFAVPISANPIQQFQKNVSSLERLTISKYNQSKQDLLVSFAERPFNGSEIVQGLVPVTDKPLPLDLDTNSFALPLGRQLGDGALVLAKDMAARDIQFETFLKYRLLVHQCKRVIFIRTQLWTSPPTAFVKSIA